MSRFNYLDELLALASKMLEQGDIKEATFLYQRAVEIFPGYADGMIAFGRLELKVKNYTHALELAIKACSVDEQSIEAFELLFESLLETGNQSEVLFPIRHILSRDNANACAVYYLLKRLVDRKLFKQAQDGAAMFIIRFPNEIYGTLIHALALIEQGHYQNALEILKPIQKGREEDPENIYVLSLLLSRVGQHESADEGFRHCLATKGTFEEAALRLAESVRQQGHASQADHFLHEYATKIGSPRVFEELSKIRKNARKPQDRLVVFVGDFLRSRQIKLAWGLKKRGWSVVSIVGRSPNADYSQFFDEIHVWQSEEDAVALACKFSPVVYHVITWAGDRLSMLLANARPGPIVMDPYDIIEGTIRDRRTAPDAILQRRSVELADGMCCRDLRSRNLFKNLGYRRKPVLFFPDYCWNDEQFSKPALRPNDEIHAVSIGTISTRNQGFDIDWGYFEFTKNAAEQGIHTHIYPSPSQSESPQFEEDFEQFLNLAETSSLVHVNRHIPASDVVETISKFHFGLNLFLPRYNKNADFPFTPVAWRHFSSARMVDYLDAGLAVCINDNFGYLAKSFIRAKVGFPFNPARFDTIGDDLRTFARRPEYASAIHRYRESLSILRHIDRLITFYNIVSELTQNSIGREEVHHA